MVSKQTTVAAYLKKAVCLTQVCILGYLMTVTTAAAQGTAEPLVETYTSPQSSLEDVLRGAPGEAYLAYYLPDNGPERPALVVRLSKEDETGEALAEVFQAPTGAAHVPVTFVDGYPALPGGLSPAVTLVAPAGWWARDGLANYNLDITVYGRIYSLWGGREWPAFLAPQTPNAAILVRDTNNDGLPDWDWRTMLPEYPNSGYYRTHYAERKCDSPVVIDPGVSPQWPYVALDGAFEQTPGVFRPPIGVNWRTGQIQHFSELVTVRNQNCTYSLYSINRVLPDQMNSPDFETPFAFYDLSGEGVGYPNLLLRTVRSIEGDPLIISNNPETQSIRYSWRNAVGDWKWDYKIDVHGQYEYNDETPIAGGMALIDAPAYEAFPEWTISRAWPAVSFVAMEQTPYLSSEGIYDWSMRSLSDPYFFGWQQEPDLSWFQDIQLGLRGEYRLGAERISDLYFSPIDNRLHLKWAEHGIWRLDDEQIVRLTNLDGDEYIDVWSREAMDEIFDVDGAAREEVLREEDPVYPSEVIETLYALDGYLLHAGGGALTLVEADYDPALFETLPPTDRDTWEAHRALLAPYEAERRDPTDLRAWLNAFPGPRGEISGATAANARPIDGGFRFELALEPGYRATGQLNLQGLAPGDYLVEQRGGQFSVSPLTPAAVTLDVRRPDPAGPAWVTASNSGAADAPDLTLVVEATWDDFPYELLRRPVDAPAGETLTTLFTVPSNLPAGLPIQARLETADGRTLAASAPLPAAPPPAADQQAVFTLERAPVLVPVVALFSIGLVLVAILSLTRRSEDVS